MKETKLSNILSYVVFSILVASVFYLAASCGSEEGSIIYKKEGAGEAYSWKELKAFCTGCHNSSAPEIPLTEAEFQASAKIREEIEEGKMPPNNPNFDVKKALKYLDGIQTKDPLEDE